MSFSKCDIHSKTVFHSFHFHTAPSIRNEKNLLFRHMCAGTTFVHIKCVWWHFYTFLFRFILYSYFFFFRNVCGQLIFIAELTVWSWTIAYEIYIYEVNKIVHFKVKLPLKIYGCRNWISGLLLIIAIVWA